MEIRLTADFLTDFTVVLNFILAITNLAYLRSSQRKQHAKMESLENSVNTAHTATQDSSA